MKHLDSHWAESNSSVCSSSLFQVFVLVQSGEPIFKPHGQTINTTIPTAKRHPVILNSPVGLRQGAAELLMDHWLLCCMKESKKKKTNKSIINYACLEDAWLNMMIRNGANGAIFCKGHRLCISEAARMGGLMGGAKAVMKPWWWKNAEKDTKMCKEKTKKKGLDESSSHSDMSFLDIKGI